MKELIKIPGERGTLELISRGGSIPDLAEAVFKAQTEQKTIDATNEEKELVFRWVSKQGVEVKKNIPLQARRVPVRTESGSNQP